MADNIYSMCNNRYFAGSTRALMVALSFFLSSLGFLSGCIPVTSRPVAPIELPAHFSIQGKVPHQADWWLDFQDNSLTLLINQALTNNFSLRIAKERIEEAQALAKQAGASLLPAVDGQGTATSTRNYQAETTSGNFFLGLAASYEIDLWGRLRSQRDAALLDVSATEADYHTAAISLAAEVAAIWYQLVESDLQLELLTQQQETNTKVLQLISAQFRSGQTGIADVLQQRQLVESINAALAGIRSEAQILEHQLAILIGVPPGTAKLPQRAQLPLLPSLPETGIPLQILTQRPDIESSFLQLSAADNRVAEAVANRLPKLSISADISTSGERPGDLFNNWFATLGANLFGPIFDGGRLKAAVAGKESIARQRFYSHGRLMLEAIGEIENGLAREKGQQIILSSQEIQLQYATDSIGHIANRYRQGGENYQRVLLALLSQQDLQRNILTSRGQLINFRIALYRALSGRIPFHEIGPIAENSDTLAPLDNHYTQARGSN